MEQEPTSEQTAIFDCLKSTNEDLLIEALAGTGKTWSLLQALSIIPQRSILLTAFNKRIAAELQERLPPLPRTTCVHVKTFHALGLSILKSKYPHLEVQGAATEALINRTAEGTAFPIRRAAVKLLRLYKEIRCPQKPDVNELEEVGNRHEVFGRLTEPQIIETVSVAFDAYLAGQDFSSRATIDFCDMVWGPIVAGIQPQSRYQAVFVDELQDLSAPQFHLLMKMIAPKGRFVGVGDRWQDIYKFRESMGASAWDAVKVRPGSIGCRTLPLTITWRSDRAIVEAANELVPDLRARPDADEGEIRECHYEQLFGRLYETREHRENGETAFVLSRSNAMLLSCALKLWSAQWTHGSERHLEFSINGGREMFEPLFEVLDTLQTGGAAHMFSTSLSTWYLTEAKKAEAANATARAERVEEQYLMLSIASAYTTPSKIKGLLLKLAGFDLDTGLLLSSVHKVKGLEADRVFLLKETFGRYAGRKDKKGEPIEPTQEDLNIEYVAITRARHEVTWVEGCV